MLKKGTLFLFITLSIFLYSCSEYSKVLKSPNPELKYQKAVEYYEEEEYLKTLPLLEELIPLYRGTDKGQKIYYYYCYTNFNLGYLITAAYHFKKYSVTYPRSEHAENALFMAAYCNYLESPIPTLDQSPTYEALNELQLFANTYPKSELIDSANTLVDNLRMKLETKAFYNAEQYYIIKRYKSAIVALNNFLETYPDSEYMEEVKLLVIKAYYYLAIDSIEEKKMERFDEGIAAYYDFIDNFDGSKKANEAELYYAKISREREKIIQENSR